VEKHVHIPCGGRPLRRQRPHRVRSPPVHSRRHALSCPHPPGRRLCACIRSERGVFRFRGPRAPSATGGRHDAQNCRPLRLFPRNGAGGGAGHVQNSARAARSPLCDAAVHGHRRLTRVHVLGGGALGWGAESGVASCPSGREPRERELTHTCVAGLGSPSRRSAAAAAPNRTYTFEQRYGPLPCLATTARSLRLAFAVACGRPRGGRPRRGRCTCPAAGFRVWAQGGGEMCGVVTAAVIQTSMDMRRRTVRPACHPHQR
jgi:hypothetical protein